MSTHYKFEIKITGVDYPEVTLDWKLTRGGKDVVDSGVFVWDVQYSTSVYGIPASDLDSGVRVLKELKIEQAQKNEFDKEYLQRLESKIGTWINV